jgi:simple sugar transport system permease protein
MLLLEAIILSVIAASTPLLLAASGELVVERSGVLNLGVEGMMIMGAACGFAGAYMSGSTLVGALCGILAGAAMAAIFGILTLGLAVNQVATGLALTILGVGLSGLIGAGFVGTKIVPAPQLYLPYLTDIPFIGRIVFGEDAFVYFSVALIIAIWLFLYRSRPGLVLRAVGDNHASAHALGYPVLRIRMLAVLFGGACAGLGGAFLPLAYTPFFIPGMTAGRGWIALALVVFSSWRPGRLVVGAYLFGAVSILQLRLDGDFLQRKRVGQRLDEINPDRGDRVLAHDREQDREGDDRQHHGDQGRGDRDHRRPFGPAFKHQLHTWPLVRRRARRDRRRPSAIRAARASPARPRAAPTACHGTSPRCGRQFRSVRRDPG